MTAVPSETPKALAGSPHESHAGPATPWLCAGLLLSGMGTVLIGPILPTLAHQWNINDAAAGTLLLAKFTGAFLGGLTVPNRLRRGILVGLAAAFAGFAAFAFAPGLMAGIIALFVAGFGLGQIIASTDILAGRRYSRHTGSAISLINFFWTLGSVLTGVVVATFLPHHSLRSLLLSFAAIFIVVALGGLLQRVADPALSEQERDRLALNPAPVRSLQRQALLFFVILLFLYGGLETSITQWLTTYTVRYTGGGPAFSAQSTIVIVWSALTAGRLITSLLLRRFSEVSVQRVGLALSALLIPVVASCNNSRTLSAACIVLGLCLAPIFPATFAVIMKLRPTTREAAGILAASGLGAAGISWLMGVVSTYAGSLRIAMAVPFGCALALLGASFWMPATTVCCPETQPPVPPPFPERARV